MKKREYHGHANRGHASRTYYTWQNMWSRCRNKSITQYADYGGRGITVCSRWKNFSCFLEDMGEVPPGLSLDRRNNNKGYSKANCRWATRREQSQNTRKNVNLHYAGQTLCMSEWARTLSIPLLTLYTRLELGWSVKRALTEPAVKGKNQFGGEKKLTLRGKTQTVHAWAAAIGIKPGTLHHRLWLGWSVKRALTTPVMWQR